MKKHHKIGNRKGRPAYRTPSRFIYKKVKNLNKGKNKEKTKIAK